jgi:hypothetical protein
MIAGFQDWGLRMGVAVMRAADFMIQRMPGMIGDEL